MRDKQKLAENYRRYHLKRKAMGMCSRCRCRKPAQNRRCCSTCLRRSKIDKHFRNLASRIEDDPLCIVAEMVQMKDDEFLSLWTRVMAEAIVVDSISNRYILLALAYVRERTKKIVGMKLKRSGRTKEVLSLAG